MKILDRVTPFHDVWFYHPFTHLELPICRACGAQMTAEIFASDAPCPGTPQRKDAP